MGIGEKLVGGLVAVALATTLLLPDRQTVPVLKTFWDGVSGAFRTVMGR